MTENEDNVGASIGVLIVIGVRLYREGLARLLPEQAGIVVKGVVADQASAGARAQMLAPDVVLLDSGLPDSSGTVRTLLKVAPGSRVVALAANETELEILSFAQAGISGYVTREGSFEDLVATIRSVARGEFLCSPRISALLLRQVARAAADTGSCPERLTPRELQIVRLIDQGLTNKEIASSLNIEVSTVKNHVHHILEKLSATGRGQAVARVRPVLLSHHASI